MSRSSTVNTLEDGDHFDVMRLRKRVHDHQPHEFQIPHAPTQIASERDGVARHVNEASRAALAHGI